MLIKSTISTTSTYSTTLTYQHIQQLQHINNIKKHIFFIAILASLFFACKEDSRRNDILAAKIQEKVADFRMRKLSECRRQALDIATTNADSILLKNADLWQIRGDLIPRPPRPSKPGAPNITVKVDSSPAKPLFPFK